MNKINFENLPSTNTPINSTNLNQIQTNAENSINGTSDLTGSSGYIRYDNGIQIAWKQATVTAGGTAWTGTGLYYSDHSMGNWEQPFSSILSVSSGVNSIQYWTTNGNISNTSAGTIRALRPTSVTQSVAIWIMAIGTWSA